MDRYPALDVAIVGGGISGIYTAWRLLRAQKQSKLTGALAKWKDEDERGELKVGVYEGSNRIGGRLLSARSPKMPDTTCELGGMRYATSHSKVAKLVEELGLSSSPHTVDLDSNICFLRNNQLRRNQLGDMSALPYNFNPWEKKVSQGSDAFAIIKRVLQKALPDFDQHQQKGRACLFKWLQSQSVSGKQLNKWGFWNLLLHCDYISCTSECMSTEGYEAAIDTIGYDVLGANYNAVDMIAEIFDFEAGVTYRQLKDGYEKLPWTLRQQFEKEYEGMCYPQSWLSGFRHDESGVFTLHFKDGNQVTARALVLAMPRASLEILSCESPLLRAIQSQLNAVAPIRLFKAFLIYDTPWWENADVVRGRSVTDMPLRQCYYWAVADQTASEETRGRAAIMVYNDVVNTDYWRGLTSQAISPLQSVSAEYSNLHPVELERRKIEPKYADPPEFFQAVGPDVAPSLLPVDDFHTRLVSNWRDNRAGEHFVREMEPLLLRMHGITRASQLLDAAYKDWKDAVHLWEVGYRSWEVMKKVVQPEPPTHCYICGEAYSTYQTWVEGALQTSECVLGRLGVTDAIIADECKDDDAT